MPYKRKFSRTDKTWDGLWYSPKPQAQLCPVCQGTGWVNRYAWATSANLFSCHGCGGKGWVTV